MRLHHLTVTAFGPFAGTEHVDFDALNDAGLFLLSGATGAGKTSILDAVCFALYGSVPGVRGVKALKSQHAASEVAPEVVLDFSVRDRRFLVRRSPEWVRPKRRGDGFRTEKAAASLTELAPGGERLVTHRAAEVGLTVTDLVGMQAAQFQQVAMLPQGEFQRFLQADSKERHDVLQRLFRTDRFARIEDWVHDHSRRLREESGAGERAVQRILAAVADRGAVELPESYAGDGFTSAASGAAILAWARRQLGAAEGLLAESVDAHRVAVLARSSAQKALAEQRRTAEAVRRRDEARARMAELTAAAPEADEARAALAADRRAAACLPVLDMLDRAAGECNAAAMGRIRAMAGLGGVRRGASQHQVLEDLLGDVREAPSAEDLERSERRARALLTRVEDLLPRMRDLTGAETALAETEAGLVAARAELEQVEDARAALPAARRALADRMALTRTAAGRREALALVAAAAEERRDATAALPAADAELRARQDTHRDARDRAADARELVQELTDRRLDGIAAELAGDLADGQACQVCGSTRHPELAVPTTAQVTQAEQDEAQGAFETADQALQAAAAEVSAADQVLAGLVQRAEGRDAQRASAELEELSEQLRVAEQAGSALVELEGELDELAKEAERLDQQVADQEVRIATLAQTARTHRSAIEALQASLAEVLGEHAAPAEVTEHVELLRAVVGALGPARAAEARHAQATAALADVEHQATATTDAQGFSSGRAARAAVLTEADRDALNRLLTRRSESAATAAAVLAETDVATVGDAGAPDLGAAETAMADAETRAAETTRTLHEREDRVRALQEQVGRLDRTLTGWEPVREVSHRAEAMSQLVRGTGGDNQLQMRLSAYVLATRLDQVLAAANERLSHMRDQRYLLQRTGRAARKGSQAGLGLEMVDQWTGDVRDPATLSGGETFVVSLALALGLADVVTHEAGGTEIETLFVDEGFGMLDADTLDDVMDRLDGLRAGGRSVGVVSHVTELRSRIPTQLHVRKTPTGSSISTAVAVG